MKKILKIKLTAIAMMTASPAFASNLILYDFNAMEGERIAQSAYADQDLARMTRQGLVRPIVIPIDDNGSPITTTVDVLLPINIPPLGIGTRILTSSIRWNVTTQRIDDKLEYENFIQISHGFTNGITTNQQTNTEISVAGVAPMFNAGKPVFAKRYNTPGGAKMLIGLVVP